MIVAPDCEINLAGAFLTSKRRSARSRSFSALSAAERRASELAECLERASPFDGHLEREARSALAELTRGVKSAAPRAVQDAKIAFDLGGLTLDVALRAVIALCKMQEREEYDEPSCSCGALAELESVEDELDWVLDVVGGIAVSWCPVPGCNERCLVSRRPRHVLGPWPPCPWLCGHHTGLRLELFESRVPTKYMGSTHTGGMPHHELADLAPTPSEIAIHERTRKGN
ncbi:MAG: hypothetical protein IPG04_16785 [Polyangiaceae bacterium]|nr:hypothetical protein [Polyangiaceae bacterium]